ncbi:MAG TPA: amylo-alpha-1,6-glucosidase, partial [Verrucomicrobiae bacterium]
LTEGGMHWAYSELFQNYSGKEVAWYLDYANRQSERLGAYVHYSETHDNDRLAKKGRAWSLLRNRLCALASPSGGFGFTCGVEWLATEKILVHGNTGLNWDNPANIVPELTRLNRLLADHPCFFDGVKLTRLSAPDAPVYALLRQSAEGKDWVLVLVNTDLEHERTLELVPRAMLELQFAPANLKHDLLGQPLPKMAKAGDKVGFVLPPAAVFCLAPDTKPAGLAGDAYRRARAQAAFAVEALNKFVAAETLDGFDWRWLAQQVDRSPGNVLAAAAEFAAHNGRTPLAELLLDAALGKIFPRVVTWTLLDTRRVTLLPAGHWLLIEDVVPFRATLQWAEPPSPPAAGKIPPRHVQSIAAGGVHVACFPPYALGPSSGADAQLTLERHGATAQKISATIRPLAPEPLPASPALEPSTVVLLTNGRGGMARICVDLGRVNSKYDCILGANLHPTVPVDRHIFVKRIRAWVNADGFLSPLHFKNLVSFKIMGRAALWQFVANAGDGRVVEVALRAEMVEGENTVILQFSRPTEKLAHGKQLPAAADVRVTVRPDIEDRNFHCETKHNDGGAYHFSAHAQAWRSPNPDLRAACGFSFTPAGDRRLQIFADAGEYHPQPEWCENIAHPVEQTRGQVGSGDAYSPGWFELPLNKGASVSLTITAEAGMLPRGQWQLEDEPAEHDFRARLKLAVRQFVVRRDAFKTVIAGYPWFLDWGRDSLICARGLLAAGLTGEVKEILQVFGRFEKDGTLPNTIHGHDVSNRDTSDAPLWFAVVCEDLADAQFFDVRVDGQRTVRDVLISIAENYSRGTPNGIRMDHDSALIWSPSHFTWMDTNYPAGTPR